MMPPLITVGSRSPASSRACDHRRWSWSCHGVASDPPRKLFKPHQFGPASRRGRHDGDALGRGPPSVSGLSRLDRGRDHDHVGAIDVLGLVGRTETLTPLVAQVRRANIAALGPEAVPEPLHGYNRDCQQRPRRYRSLPDGPPIPDEVDGVPIIYRAAAAS